MEENVNVEPNMQEESMGGAEEMVTPEPQPEPQPEVITEEPMEEEKKKSGIIGFIKGLFQ